jgi:hypothetical protein
MIITFVVGKVILGGYWLVFAPALSCHWGLFFSARRYCAESLDM